MASLIMWTGPTKRQTSKEIEVVPIKNPTKPLSWDLMEKHVTIVRQTSTGHGQADASTSSVFMGQTVDSRSIVRQAVQVMVRPML